MLIVLFLPLRNTDMSYIAEVIAGWITETKCFQINWTCIITLRVLIFIWRDWSRPSEVSVRITNHQTVIPTGYVLNTSQTFVTCAELICLVALTNVHNQKQFWFYQVPSMSLRDSSVGIVTGYGLDARGSIPGRSTIFLFSITSRPTLGPTQPPIQWVPVAHSLGIKQPGSEADHSPSSSVEVKNIGAIPPIPNTFPWSSA
jgi:hypothetical protein